MKLQRIRLAQFRQFRHGLTIDGLQPGINLFTGPNEAGKSTIVAAIRAAFFERHRSSSVDDLRPWGDPSATPEVELDFRIGDTDYQLSKRFLGKKRCTLRFGGQQLDGETAEDHLAELLGFQHASKGASAAKHWGIPGLLWIQQGTGQDIREPVAHATDHLRTALNASLGQVASSGGDEVLAQVEAQRHELLTPAGGAPRGVYADALKGRDKLQAELQALDADVAVYRGQVDQLATLRQAHAADTDEQPWASFRQQAQAARERLAGIAQLQAALASDQQRARQLAEQVALQREQLAAWAAQDTAAQTRAAQLQAAQQQLHSVQAEVAQWASQATAAAAQAEATRRQARQVQAAAARATLARELQQLQQQAAQGEARLQQAEAEHLRWLGLQQQVAAGAIDDKQLATLRQQTDGLRELQIRQDAVATRLQFTLAEGTRLRLWPTHDATAAHGRAPNRAHPASHAAASAAAVSPAAVSPADQAAEPPVAAGAGAGAGAAAAAGDWLSGQGERLLLDGSMLDLGPLGQLRILPGGDDLPELRRAAAALAEAQAALLQRLGLPDLAAAEARHRAQAQRLAERQQAAATLKAIAPQGLDALRADAVAQAVRAQAIAAELARLPEAAPPPQGWPALADAEADEERARQALAQVNASLGQARQAAAQAQTALDAAQREQAAAQALLDAPERAARLQAANQALVDARAEQAALAQSLSARTDAVAQAQPEVLAQDVTRFQQSADALVKVHDERAQALLRLEVALDSAGARGLDERRAALARDLDQASRRATELARRAAALDHLLGLLQAKREALTRQLQAPLQRHLQHYLQLLMPQAELAIGEQLSPGSLTRPGAQGPESGALDALSFGAREQLGVISRLAYADLLQAAGRPTLILLDDALVHSDDERLARMKRVLFDAGTRHQILLFTCHPALWRDLGVPARPVASLTSNPQGTP